MSRVIIPLDVASKNDALALVDRLGDQADFYKVGFELYTRSGPDVVRTLVELGKKVFLDIKLHDIPNTVGRAVGAASDLGVDLLTVHRRSQAVGRDRPDVSQPRRNEHGLGPGDPVGP